MNLGYFIYYLIFRVDFNCLGKRMHVKCIYIETILEDFLSERVAMISQIKQYNHETAQLNIIQVKYIRRA